MDENGRDVLDGEIGSLLISGDAICSCYWNQHEKTKETIQGHWVRTGDKYYRDPDGYYWYVGRNDDMMKVKGMWVSPVEIENVLMEHPMVQEAAAIGSPDGNQLVKPAAYIVLKQEAKNTPQTLEEIRQHVLGKLAAYKCPQTFEVVAELPRRRRERSSATSCGNRPQRQPTLRQNKFATPGTFHVLPAYIQRKEACNEKTPAFLTRAIRVPRAGDKRKSAMNAAMS